MYIFVNSSFIYHRSMISMYVGPQWSYWQSCWPMHVRMYKNVYWYIPWACLNWWTSSLTVGRLSEMMWVSLYRLQIIMNQLYDFIFFLKVWCLIQLEHLTFCFVKLKGIHNCCNYSSNHLFHSIHWIYLLIQVWHYL